jgi:hypothetical protein
MGIGGNRQRKFLVQWITPGASTVFSRNLALAHCDDAEKHLGDNGSIAAP